MIRRCLQLAYDLCRPKSSLEALKKILPSALYRQLLMITPDRRMCFESAAQLSRREISEIIHETASLLGVSVLPRIPPIPKDMLSILPSTERLEIGAVVPLCASSVVSGVVCVDPALMRAAVPEFANLPVFIGSWSDIKTALTSEAPTEHVDQPTLFEQVLRHLTSEMKRHQRDTCVIRIGENIAYQIPLTESQHAEGTIHSIVKRDLIKGLTDHVSNQKRYLSPDSGDLFSVFSREDLFEIKRFDSKAMSANILEFIPIELQAGSTDSQQTVLLIDDNATFARVLDKFLAKQGFVTRYMPNGAEAIEALRSGAVMPSLIVCDIHMPVMNGFEFVRTLRAESDFKHLPLLMLTSDGDVEAEITLLSYGIEAFIGKNEDPRILCMHVKRILERLSQKAA